VEAECKFWNYDFKWISSCYNLIVFQRSELKIKIMHHDEFLSYKLIGDVARGAGWRGV